MSLLSEALDCITRARFPTFVPRRRSQNSKIGGTQVVISKLADIAARTRLHWSTGRLPN